jgi:hypothetical protein
MRLPRKMNTGMQRYNLERMVNDTKHQDVDIHSLMDRNLNYRENADNIRRVLGIQTRNYGVEQFQQRAAEQKRERKRRHDNPDRLTGRLQNEHNRELDRAIQAMPPGKRFARKSSHRYYERRENRADRGRWL